MPEKKNNNDIAVDLFCGAGGASCGIEAAGFDIAAAVDHNKVALNTHADNCDGYTIKHDLSNVNLSVLPERARSPDYVHGSPPCKGFSNANDKRSIDDPRNSLVFDFLAWVERLQPAVVTMENVTGMTTITDHFMDKLEAAFRDAGYAVKWRVLNAADYGVPQTRRRVITVGVRQDLDVPSRWFPKPSHAQTSTTTLDGRQIKEWVSVEQAIGDLSQPVGSHRQQNDNNGTSGCIWRQATKPAHTVKGQGSHTMRADGGNSGFRLTDQINEAHQQAGRRPLQQSEDPSNTILAGKPPLKLSNHVTQDHGKQAIKRFQDILTGRRDGNGLSGRVARPENPSPTITADETAAVPPIWPANHKPRESTSTEPHERESEQPPTTITNARLADKGHHKHNWDGARRLTVRECARIQSFPDSFVFSGTKTSQYAQVGNAVPPLLQYHVSENLRQKVLCEDAYPPRNQ